MPINVYCRRYLHVRVLGLNIQWKDNYFVLCYTITIGTAEIFDMNNLRKREA